MARREVVRIQARDTTKVTNTTRITNKVTSRITTASPASSFHLPLLVAVILLLLPRISCFSDPSFPPHRLSYESYAHEVWLEDSGAFVVQWTPRQDDIEFRVIARTTGYLGFGLSSKPRMDGADIVVG